MFPGSIKLGHAFGIDVQIHWTFLPLPFVIVGMSLLYGDSLAHIAIRMILLVAILASVFWHEMGHALAARRFQIPTRDITLTPLCGLARLEGRPERPWHEFIIAIAGPAANLLVAVVCCGIILLAGGTVRPPTELFYDSFLRDLMWINALLFGLNLLPVFPMDGGRVLRAVLAYYVRPARATLIAVRLGQTLALGIGCAAAFYRHPVILILAIFLFVAAQYELVLIRRGGSPEPRQTP